MIAYFYISVGLASVIVPKQTVLSVKCVHIIYNAVVVFQQILIHILVCPYIKRIFQNGGNIAGIKTSCNSSVTVRSFHWKMIFVYVHYHITERCFGVRIYVIHCSNSNSGIVRNKYGACLSVYGLP